VSETFALAVGGIEQRDDKMSRRVPSGMDTGYGVEGERIAEQLD
jgi:hypothetical protein